MPTSAAVARDVYDRIGDRIRELRAAQGMSQAELAERVGLTDEAVSRAERGVTLPTVRTLGSIARALGVGLAELAEGGAPAGSPPRTVASDELAEYASPELKRLRRLLPELEPRSLARLLDLALLLPRKRSPR